jgi:palmitoyltransferase ZDHHC9/14/18
MGQLKFCHTCKIFRPPQTVHCKECNSCLRRMDHHCNWIGTCVGLRNYRHFLLFTFLLFSYCVYVFFSSMIYLGSISVDEAANQPMNYNHIFDAMKKSPLILILLLYVFLASYISGMLFFYH